MLGTHCFSGHWDDDLQINLIAVQTLIKTLFRQHDEQLHHLHTVVLTPTLTHNRHTTEENSEIKNTRYSVVHNHRIAQGQGLG